MDRGGLIHVSDMMYLLFASMETETRSKGIKGKLMKHICKSDDVLFYWATIAL